MIEIDGKLYEPKERENSRSSPITSLVTAMMMPYMMNGIGQTAQGHRLKIDIPSEYVKILKKESALSRNDRDWVVWAFKKNYREVTPEEIKQREERVQRLMAIVKANNPGFNP